MKKLFPFILFLIFFFSKKSFSQSLYAIDSVTKIELFFAEEDWEYPLHYYRSLKKGDRHKGRAIINDKAYEGVGVRFKGFSSYRRNFKKNPLSIKLNYTNKKAHHQNRSTLKLSNGNLDPSWLREILSYQIARKYMVAPQSNYAQVFVNDKYYGLFGNTEDVDKKFAQRNFDAASNCTIIKGNAPAGPFSGHRSSLEYLGEDTTLYANAYELESDNGWEDLKDLTKTLVQHPAKIESILNMDGAIWMLAFNNVLVNLDSYSDFQQNYYLIRDQSGRFNFVLWDLNLSFDGLGKAKGIIAQPEYNPLAKKDDPRFPLINLVLNNPTYRKIYFAHCRTILKDNFANDWYKGEIEKHRRLIDEAVKKDKNWNFNYTAFQENYSKAYITNDTYAHAYPGIIELMEARKKYLENHLEYKKSTPTISNIVLQPTAENSKKIAIAVQVENGQNALFCYREKNTGIFKKALLMDNGQNGDSTIGDGIFSTTITLSGNSLEYYIFSENSEAARFSPERAEHEYHTFKLTP